MFVISKVSEEALKQLSKIMLVGKKKKKKKENPKIKKFLFGPWSAAAEQRWLGSFLLLQLQHQHWLWQAWCLPSLKSG